MEWLTDVIAKLNAVELLFVAVSCAACYIAYKFYNALMIEKEKHFETMKDAHETDHQLLDRLEATLSKVADALKRDNKRD